jgi:hypothetical protein
MKTKRFKKRLGLNKKTIANLNKPDMQSLRGGTLHSYKTCAFTRAWECDTAFTCTDPRMCECTWTCTLPCPVTAVIPCWED